MASALMILFLGCWLAGQSGVSGWGTDSTQPGTMLTATHPGSAGPGTESGDKKSPSTPRETDGTDPTKLQQLDYLTAELEGEDGTDPTGTQQTDPPTTDPQGGGSKRNLNIPIIAGVSAAAAGLLLFLLLAFVCYRRTRGRKGPAPRQSRESEAASTVYALLGEGKQLDVLPQEPDTGAKGHTYAELGCQELQAKQGESAPAPEPVLYATIDVSQVPDGQSPQGAGAPPTHSP
ncbi:uncharacterized protein RBU57_017495 isoform 9-T9 [Macrochelys suwanniensis]